MQMSPAKLAAAAAVVGFLGFGSVQLAFAQEDPTTSTTVEESTTDDSVTDGSTTDEDCPKDGEARADATADDTSADAS
jgi:hypothetical protein